jgi:hypothetical protein
MPVSLLLVEGDLDLQVLRPIFGGSPVVEVGGSKYSLAPRSRSLRTEKKTPVCYLRDRDFDSEPATDISQPTVDRRLDDGTVLGWRWCRHEIESYLIDPELVADATGWDKTGYAMALGEAARGIRQYQVARWVVGQARRSLPPNYELTTKPEELGYHEYRLPGDPTDPASMRWAREHMSRYFARIQQILATEAIEASIAARQATLTEPVLTDPATTLVWCSGKDLLAALQPWLQAGHGLGVKTFLNMMRDWVMAHPDVIPQRIPEWEGLLRAVRA